VGEDVSGVPALKLDEQLGNSDQILADLAFGDLGEDSGHSRRQSTDVDGRDIRAALGGVGAGSNALSKCLTTEGDKSLALGLVAAQERAKLVSLSQDSGGVPALELDEQLADGDKVGADLAGGQLGTLLVQMCASGMSAQHWVTFC